MESLQLTENDGLTFHLLCSIFVTMFHYTYIW